MLLWWYWDGWDDCGLLLHSINFKNTLSLFKQSTKTVSHGIKIYFFCGNFHVWGKKSHCIEKTLWKKTLRSTVWILCMNSKARSGFIINPFCSPVSSHLNRSAKKERMRHRTPKHRSNLPPSIYQCLSAWVKFLPKLRWYVSKDRGWKMKATIILAKCNHLGFIWHWNFGFLFSWKLTSTQLLQNW